ncbi:copper-translocating P-type ATPase [Loigolactobacillus coryniformis]|uniref:heavy metal translocating P-type ATPase n=1 Tax=Loigolactobacillus coryniformis TaxID=1610 RepID=UPI00234249EB|nr:heavy metal translocating P-type ATPase [Loigolactobacillus coryniformis]MDC4186225.1 copper-translocating P-type ATPase [Loigolactobacillus coryniformis]
MAAKDKMKMGHDMESMDHDMSGDTMMHGGHMMHMGNLKQKFWVALILTIPVILLTPMMGLDLPFQFTFPGSDWLVLIVATFLFIYGGKPFLQGAQMELTERKPAMMTLIALGISVAYIYSVWAFIANHFLSTVPHQMDFFWELATLITIMLLGHWLEMNAISSAGSAVEKMAALLPGQAHVLQADGSLQDIELAELQAQQQVVVKAGEKIPADGRVVAGQSAVNEALVTGEAKLIEKTPGAQVIGGAVNGTGTLTIEVTGTGETGYLSQVMKLVQQAQQHKSQAENLADKVAGWLFYAATIIGLVTFIVWLSLSGLNVALERTVTVLVIACPHALGLAIPLVVARSTALGATHGLLLRNRNALEAAKQIDTVLMDKTGTLTEGNFKVKSVVAFDQESQDDILRLMAALEANASHPLAVGILAAAKAKKLVLPTATDVKQLSGVGLQGRIDQVDYAIVTAAYLRQKQLDFEQTVYDELAAQGNSISFLLRGEQVLGLIAQGDQIKLNAADFIQHLKVRGIRPVMLTGDNQAAAALVAQQLGIDDFHAQLLPEDKTKMVAQYQAQGQRVLMVGDGINDAPSLAAAEIGVAIGAGTDVAIDSADVVLVRSDPADIINFLNLAQRTMRKMVQNLWWGAGYNIVALPLAAGILAPIGVLLSPAVGAVLMSLSTIVVAINALTLKLK